SRLTSDLLFPSHFSSTASASTDIYTLSLHDALPISFIPSAGGPYRLPGDYVWGNQRLPYSQSGQWGYFRVLPTGDSHILPLSKSDVGSQKAEAQPVEGQALPTALK